MSDFDRCLPIILKAEGGYSNHPNDPGGATNKGITQRVYDAWRDARPIFRRPVKEITDPEVAAIYRERYWDAIDGDAYEWPYNLVLFDLAVNSGVRRALLFVKEGHTTVAGLLTRRERYYENIIAANPKLKVFERGWGNRLKHLKDIVMAEEV